MPQAVIFDIDGTLVDSVDLHAEAWVKAFEKFGYSATHDQMRNQIGKGGEFILPDFLSDAEIEKDGDAITHYRKTYFHENLLQHVKPFPKVTELFQRLKGDGIRIALASSAQPETAEHYEKLLGVTDLIDGLTCKGDVDKAKPDPDIFIAALEKLGGMPATEAIVVGDSPYDAQAANKIKLSTVGVLCGGFSQEVLQDAGCIAIYQDPADLLEHYDQSPLSPSR